jgi:hypothetical protein
MLPAMPLDSHSDVTVAAYTRAPLLLDPVDAKVTTLRSLATRGLVDAVSLHTWPSSVSAGDHVFEDVRTVYRRCREWASRNDVSVRPAFAVDVERGEPDADGETVIRPPVLCLAIHVDDHLRWVFPHEDGETTYTAAHGVAALKTDELPPRAGAPALPGGDRPDRCDVCRGPLVNVHGVLACEDCLRPTHDGERPVPVPGTPALSAGN